MNKKQIRKSNFQMDAIVVRTWFIAFLMVMETFSTIGFSGMVANAFYLALGERETMFDAYLLPMLLGILFLVLAFVFALAKDRLSIRLSERIRENVRRQIFAKALKIGSFKDSTFSQSSLTTISMEGVEELDNFYAGFLPSLEYALLMPLALMGLCVSLGLTASFANPAGWVYGVSMFAIIPFIPLLIGVMAMSIAKVFKKYWEVYLKMGGTFTDSLRGMSLLKDLSASKRKGDLLDRQSEDFRKITMKVLTTELVSLTIMDLLSFGGVGAGMTIALYFGVNMNRPDVWAFALFLILISFQFFVPMRNVASLAMVAGRGMMAIKKIKGFLDLPEGSWGNKQPEKWNVTVEDLSFAYPDSKKGEKALKNITMKLDDRGLYGIVGISGSGKSTLAKLLSGYMKPDGGVIAYGEDGLQEIKRDWFFQNVAFVEGGNNFLSGKIRDAFHFFNSELTDDEIHERLSRFGLLELIESKDLLDYEIGEFNKNISLGERQRLVLAAVFSSNHQVWILDEVSSALDQESRDLVDQQIEELARTSLVIMISHTLQETFDAKEIFVMDKGTLAEHGTKDFLLAKKGTYFDLYRQERKEGGAL